MQFHHGITAQEEPQGIVPMRNADTSTLCIICYSEDADTEMYPFNTPVLLAGIKQSNLDKAGDKTGEKGTLGKCLKDTREEHNPTLIVLRLSDPANVDAVDVLRRCKSMFGVQPKVVVAPEIDTPAMARKMLAYCQDRRAITYVAPRRDDGTLITDIAEIVRYRDKFGAREIIIVENEWGMPEVQSAGNKPNGKRKNVSYINLG